MTKGGTTKIKVMYPENDGRFKKGYTKIIRKVLVQLCLAGISLVFIFPFIWLISTSLKAFTEASSLSLQLIPKHIKWDNYVEIFQKAPFARYMLNTIFLAVVSVFGQVLTCSLVAYSLTHIEWVGKKILFPIIMATMLLPYQVTLIPVYMIYFKLKMVGTYWPLIIPAFVAAPIYVFLIRQFFLTLPTSIIQAARIDGASHFRIYSTIVVPLSKPVFTAVAVFTFLNTWSDFMGPLIYLNKSELYTISIGLKSYIGEHYTEWNLVMAASAVATIPIIIVYFFAQKQFIEGITMTGIKG
jgi:multiple sugar transport system permease protein